MSKFYKINNRDEFISFVEKMRDNFDCPEDWEQFFGVRLKTDEDGNELETLKEYAQEHNIDSEPWSYEYPVILYCNIAYDRDRFGRCGIRILEMESLNNL
jgi:hypothetical protein